MARKPHIDFSDRDFSARPRQSQPSGLQDEVRHPEDDGMDYTREEDYRDDDRYYPENDRYYADNDSYYPSRDEGDYDDYPESGYDDYRDDYSDDYRDDYRQDYPEDYHREAYPRRKNQPKDYYPRRDSYPKESYPRDSYREGYRDGFRDNAADTYPRGEDYKSGQNRMSLEESAEKAKNFIGRHPVMMNFIYVCLASVMVVMLLLWFLDFWTFHGQERAVPDVKGQSLEMAEGNISRAGLRCVVTDSVYESFRHPGTVVEQMPIPSSRIKKGGTVYVTIVAFTPKMVTIPNFYDVSERQARSMLEGLGIKQVMTVTVPSEYQGLVMGAMFNGVSLAPGAKVPVTAVITLQVGGGNYDTQEESPIESEPIVDEEAIEETLNTLDLD